VSQPPTPVPFDKPRRENLNTPFPHFPISTRPIVQSFKGLVANGMTPLFFVYYDILVHIFIPSTSFTEFPLHLLTVSMLCEKNLPECRAENFRRNTN
jgi:hypothetical protein